MIPKIIHYCWFGGNKKSKLIINCIASWSKHLPDYEIIEWNEDNCDLTSAFLQSCIELKKWAFISDYIRLKKVYEFGGVYLDTDMLVIKNLDLFLNHDCFFGAEDSKYISAGIIGASINNSFIKKILDSYLLIKDVSQTSDFSKITIPKIITKTYFELNNNVETIFTTKMEINNIVVYPFEKFYPLPFAKRYEINKYKKYIYPETYAIHLWNGSWLNYSEFHYLREGAYKKGFLKIIKGDTSQKLNLKYFKKIVSSINQSLKK